MRERALQCGATMRPPTSRTPKGKKNEKARIDLRSINEVLLAERLGLDNEWIERWQVLREESLAPSELPKFIPAKIARDAKKGLKNPKQKNRDVETQIKEAIKNVEAGIERLVAAGCCRPVLYFCLEELSPEAAEIRAGQGRVTIADKDGEYDLLAARRPPRPRPSHEDMEAVRNKAIAARRVIHKYRRELVLVADASERLAAAAAWKHPVAEASENPGADKSKHPDGDMTEYRLPCGLMTTPQSSEDALDLLTDSLTWVSRLAEAYTAPYEKKILKSKSLLYLTAYVTLVADANKIRGQDRARLCSTLARLANLVAWKADNLWSPSDLQGKLDKFGKDHPRLHKLLVKKLDELHRFHSAG